MGPKGVTAWLAVLLIRPYALAKLPAATICALVQPRVAIDSCFLTIVFADMNWLGDALQRRKEPTNAHGKGVWAKSL